jgi:hypothetical protein
MPKLNIDVKTVKPVLKPKSGKVKDPPRYPKVINGYENKMKKSLALQTNLMMGELTKKMVEFKKPKK